MKRPHPFRFEKRQSKRGPVYYVIYDFDPAHPKSTGVLVNVNDKNDKWAPAGYDDVVAWAYASLEKIQIHSDISFGEFARDFFDPEKCTWTRRQLIRLRRSGRKPFGADYLPAHNARLKNYLLPRWRAVPLNMITVKGIDEWLVELDSIKYGIPLAPASLDKILVAMRKIMEEAEYQGYIKGNAAAKVKLFGGEGKSRLPFTMQEIRILFPEDVDKAVRHWQSLSWYAYFLLQWTCGLRPGEAGAFMLSDWIKEHHGAVIRRSIENRTLNIKGLKTDKKGITVKPVVFSDKLESVLTLLEYQEHAQDQLLFTVNGGPIKAETANKHFKASAKRAGIETGERTQYCLRHTFYTEALKRMPEKEVEKMAGHKALRKEYDHRKGIDFLKAAQPLRGIINDLNKEES